MYNRMRSVSLAVWGMRVLTSKFSERAGLLISPWQRSPACSQGEGGPGHFVWKSGRREILSLETKHLGRIGSDTFGFGRLDLRLNA